LWSFWHFATSLACFWPFLSFTLFSKPDKLLNMWKKLEETFYIGCSLAMKCFFINNSNLLICPISKVCNFIVERYCFRSPLRLFLENMDCLDVSCKGFLDPNWIRKWHWCTFKGHLYDLHVQKNNIKSTNFLL